MKNLMQSGLALLITGSLLAACGGDDPSGPDLSACPGGTELRMDHTVSGTLAEGDALDIDGAYLDRFAFGLDSGGTVRISMTSEDVNAWLWLLSSDESVLGHDNDSGTGTNSLLVQSLDAGCYYVEATTAFPGESGSYTLTLSR